jgi:HAMP domain-containing protein
MSSQSENGDSIRRYLLGDLSEQEREQVEQRLMSDDDLYQRLLLAEDDLIDDYISGALLDQDQAKLRQHFLRVPELRQDIKSVAALRKYALQTTRKVVKKDSPTPLRFSLFGWLKKFFTHPSVGVSFAAASLAAVVIAVWLGTQVSQLRRQVEQLQARQTSAPVPQPGLEEQLASERLRNEQLSAEFRRQQELLAEKSREVQPDRGQPQPTPGSRSAPPSGVPAFVAFTLTPGAVRDAGELKKVPLSPATREVRIRLDLSSGGYRSYRAALRTADGREVWSAQRLRAAGAKFVQVNIPARLLASDDYQILLSGLTSSGETEELDSYYFRVSR